jgi:phosphoribosylaminoimidazole-succinocarboxamide synthase
LSDGYKEKQASGEKQNQLSKEFVRQWLITNDFQGKDGQKIPEMNDSWVNEISDRYVDLYEKITGKKFDKDGAVNSLQNIQNSIIGFLENYPNN